MFSRTTEYALRAMALLAYAPDQLTPTPDLAERTKVPPNYLAKVLQQLASAGLIVGRRGVGGGYRLTKRAADINLIDIVRAVGELERIKECPLGLPNHGPNLCPLHKKMDEAAARVIDLFKDTMLSDLVAAPGANKPLCDDVTTAKLSISSRGTTIVP